MNHYSPPPSVTLPKDYQQTLNNLIRNEGGVFIPYLAKKWDKSPAELSWVLAVAYPHGVMVDNLFYPVAPNKLWFYEVCDTKYNRGHVIREDLLEVYCKQQSIEDQHISVFAKDQKWVKQITDTGSIKKFINAQVKVNSLWIELDRKYEGGYDKALHDAEQFVDTFGFPSHVRLWTSGNQSIHIEVDGRLFGTPQGDARRLTGRGGVIHRLASRVFGQLRHPQLKKIDFVDPWLESNDNCQRAYELLDRGPIHDKYKQELENIDPNIYSFNSLIRAPYSIHETGKGQKVIVKGPDTFPKHVEPWLMGYYITEYERPKPRTKTFDCGADSSYIIQEFSDIVGFDPEEADHNGWVAKLHNPFYNDENPGLSVNINDGRFWDFGDPDYQFGFLEYLMIKYSINKQQAQEMVKEYEQ